MGGLREAKLAAAVYVALALNKRRKVKRKCWVKNWVRRRDQQGAYTQLIRELQLEDAQQFRNFTRKLWKFRACEHAGPCDWQTGYSHEKCNFSGRKSDCNTSLSDNRQVKHAMLICWHCNCSGDFWFLWINYMFQVIHTTVCSTYFAYLRVQ